MGEGSGFSKGIYVWQFAMPLFEPSEVITLSWSHRVGGGANLIDSDDSEALTAAIVTALGHVDGEDAALLRMAEQPKSQNLRVEEVASYARIYLDDIQGALARLSISKQHLGGPQWLLDVAARMRHVAAVLADRGRDAAIDQLDQWSGQTATRLGIRT